MAETTGIRAFGDALERRKASPGTEAARLLALVDALRRMSGGAGERRAGRVRVTTKAGRTTDGAR